MTWGTYIRMRALLEGAAKAFDAIDLLLFVEPAMLPNCDADRVARSLRNAWDIEARVVLAPRSRAAHGGTIATIRGLKDIRFLPEYGSAGGPEQAAAVADAVRPDTRLIIAHRLNAGLAVTRADTGLPIVINLDDVEHLARGSAARSAMSLWDRATFPLRLRALEREELGVLGRVDGLLVCSAQEKRYLEQRGIGRRIEVVPMRSRFAMRPTRPTATAAPSSTSAASATNPMYLRPRS